LLEALNIVSGKGYDTSEQAGQSLWQQVGERLQATRIGASDTGPALAAAADAARYGAPSIVLPRLGQGSFRVLVTDAYGTLTRKHRLRLVRTRDGEICGKNCELEGTLVTPINGSYCARPEMRRVSLIGAIWCESVIHRTG
jgi:hypothetical protein